MTAQDLKNAILQLAVQGKLVPQDPNDEPAPELLKRIKTEKEQLVKEGKVKKEKPISPITDDEIPFDIPESWEWSKIGHLFTIIRGITFPAEAKAKTPSPDLVPCATTGSVQDNYNSNADVFVSSDYVKRDDQWLLSHDIIMSTANSRELVGKTCIWNGHERKTFGGFLTVLRPADGIYPVYAYFALMSIKARGAFLKSATQTTNIANINTQVISNTLFPLPPLAEQRRIVAKIEELMPLVEEYGKAEEQLTALNAEFPDKLRKSILQQAIQGKLTERDPADEPASELLKRIWTEKERLVKEGKFKKDKPLPPITEDAIPFEIPDTWVWVRFYDTVDIASNLVDPGKYQDYMHIAPDNIEKGTGVLLPCRTVKEDAVASPNHLFYTGQLIYSKIRPLLRKAVIAPFDGLCSADMYPINTWINSRYLQMIMLSDFFNKQVAGIISNRVKMPKINQNELGLTFFPLPPLAEQQRIVDRVNELLAVCDELK